MKKQGLIIGNTGTVGRVHNQGVSVVTDNARQTSDDSGEGWYFFFEQVELVVEGDA